MKLKAWLDAQEPPVTQFAFAARIQRDPSTVTKWMKGEAVPDSTTMRRIIEETGGDVTPNDFFDISVPEEADPEVCQAPQPQHALSDSNARSLKPSAALKTSISTPEAAE